MAHETGKASSVGNLLAKLFAFAGANGWVIDDPITSENTIPPYGALHKNNVYVSFSFFNNAFNMYPARGYTSGLDPSQHPNSYNLDNPVNRGLTMYMTDPSSPFPVYHFFIEDNYIHVAFQGSSYWKYWCYFGFGQCEKFGDWKHGEYFFVNNSGDVPLRSDTTSVDLVFFATKNDDTSLDGTPDNHVGWFGHSSILSGIDGGATSMLLELSPFAFDGYIPTAPVQFGYYDKKVSNSYKFYFMGSLPSIRAINLRGRNVNTEFNIGSDTWIALPATKEGTGGKDYLGIAFKKVV